jgi:hypothetical protein
LAPPVIQYGNESRVSWYSRLTQLPGNDPTYANHPEMRQRITSTSRQHPDHDTIDWPPSPNLRPRDQQQ